MPSKKHKVEITEETASGQTPAAAPDELESLKSQLAESQSKMEEYLDGWKRALADFDNYKKRIERDRVQDIQNIKGDIIKRFLPVMDDLERALQNQPVDVEVKAWASGIELILRKFQGILEAEGIQRIQAEGEMFDPNFHEAVSQEPVEGGECGTVIGVIQNGYTIGDEKRVIRPAVVRVAA